MNLLNQLLQNFKDKEILEKILKDIHYLAEKIKNDIYIMEVCGTHTMQIAKFGIRKLLPKNIKLTSGPGCPVCVTPQQYLDKAVYLARNYENLIITTFGDLFRVPGNNGSLEEEKSKGKDIRIIYSPEENIKIAQENKQKKVVFLSIGFETTMPAIACVVKEAKEKNIKNLFFFLGNKFFLPALEVVILISRNFLTYNIEAKSSIDGFILPGHLSSIIGKKPYEWIATKYKLPGVIAGFEPVDIAISIKMLLEMIIKKEPEIKNEYTRVVKEEGNVYAQKLIKEVFEAEKGEWRGMGIIANSTAKFKKEYEEFDVKTFLKIPKIKSKVLSEACRCNDVLVGKIFPYQCPLFSKVCTPENPKGACMVSSEGACAAYYKYEVM